MDLYEDIIHVYYFTCLNKIKKKIYGIQVQSKKKKRLIDSDGDDNNIE